MPSAKGNYWQTLDKYVANEEYCHWTIDIKGVKITFNFPIV